MQQHVIVYLSTNNMTMNLKHNNEFFYKTTHTEMIERNKQKSIPYS